MTFVFSAAGFIATSTSGWSPGVRMSWSAKWIWKPETPGSDPAGARISAGKSGSVERSLPIAAVSFVNCAPVSCMPSPESPAKRIVTCSTCSMDFAMRFRRYSARRRGLRSVRGARDRRRPRDPRAADALEPRRGDRRGDVGADDAPRRSVVVTAPEHPGRRRGADRAGGSRAGACAPEGRVSVRGELWRARCDVPARAGESVRIVGLDGLTLVVEPVVPAAAGSGGRAA